jgi:hypothetical protein
MFAGLALYVEVMPSLTEYRMRPFSRHWGEIGQILRLGLPIGGILGLEIGVFATTGILMGLLGADALAAHQLVMNCISVIFMVPLGIAQAATVRVAVALGSAVEFLVIRRFARAPRLILMVATIGLAQLLAGIMRYRTPAFAAADLPLLFGAALFKSSTGQPLPVTAGSRHSIPLLLSHRLLGRRLCRWLAARLSGRLRPGRSLVGVGDGLGGCGVDADPTVAYLCRHRRRSASTILSRAGGKVRTAD